MRTRNWKVKAAAQGVFSRLPRGHQLNYLFQRATNGLPISDAALRSSIDLASQHLAAVEEFGGMSAQDAQLFEFGAGWDLHMPLTMAALGAGTQVVIDIRPLLRPALAADVARRLTSMMSLGDHPDHVSFRRDLPPPAEATGRYSDDGAGTWLRKLGIKYLAPMDARATALPGHSVDLVTSTNTLEHIPVGDIAKILEEMRRLLRPDGVASFQIDYRDHWSYFDASIGVYNFLRYSDDEWARYNPSLHFQNRLRHPDYLALLENAGFDVLRDSPTLPSKEDLDALAQVPLSPRFAQMHPAEVGIRGSVIVLRARENARGD